MTATGEFVKTMIRDSRTLEQRNEPGQAFDKLARAVEALMGEHDRGPGQRRKAIALFDRILSDVTFWDGLRPVAPDLQRFVDEFSYYVAAGAPEASRALHKAAEAFSVAANGGDHAEAAKALAALFFAIRNKRFHGHPEFSGQNIRVNHSARALLRTYRALLERQVGSGE